MRFSALLAAASVASFGLASAASAYHFTPYDTHFMGHGTVQVTDGAKVLNCTANLKGEIMRTGNGKIVHAVFSDPSGACAAMTAAALPWKLMPIGANTGKLKGVLFANPDCGPADFTVGVSGGVVTFSGALGACSASGSFSTNPAIALAP